MSLKVLLADSSGLLKEVLSFSMAEKQIEFVAVETGTDALLQVKELYPDVILADVALPGVDGYNLCAMVKSDSELVSRVILLFDSMVPLDEQKAEESGYDHALKKPFNAENLFSLFEEWGFKGVPDEGVEVVPGGEIAEDEIIIEDFGEEVVKEEAAEEEKDLPTEVRLAEMPPAQDDEEKASLFEVEPGTHAEVKENETSDPFNPDEVFQVSDRDTLLESTEGILGGEVSGNEQVNLGDQEDDSSYPNVSAPAQFEVSSEKGKELLQEIVKNLSDDVVREVAWEVVPDLAERMIKEAIGKITKR